MFVVLCDSLSVVVGYVLNAVLCVLCLFCLRRVFVLFVIYCVTLYGLFLCCCDRVYFL